MEIALVVVIVAAVAFFIFKQAKKESGAPVPGSAPGKEEDSTEQK